LEKLIIFLYLFTNSKRFSEIEGSFLSTTTTKTIRSYVTFAQIILLHKLEKKTTHIEYGKLFGLCFEYCFRQRIVEIMEIDPLKTEQ